LNNREEAEDKETSREAFERRRATRPSRPSATFTTTTSRPTFVANRLTKEQAWRTAVNVAELPETL